MTYLHQVVGANVRRARRQLGYTQAFVAEQCNVSAGHISEIEHGNKFPSARLFEQLAHVLSMQPYELLQEYGPVSSAGGREPPSVLSDALKQNLISSIDEVVRDYFAR